MSLFNYKKTISFVLIFAIALVTGFSVGKIYVDTLEPSSIVTATEEDLRDKEEDLVALYNRAQNGAAVNSFTGLELFQIAEYKLNHSASYYKLMTGIVNAPMGIKQNMKGEKLKRDGKMIYNKLSPSTSSLAPSICSRVIYDFETEEILINPKGTFTSTDANNIKASFDTNGYENYTLEKYKENFNTSPTTILSYIISSITCGQKNISSVIANSDGTYSFEISLSGDYLAMAALYYSYEIKFSSGLPKLPQWVSLDLKVKVDQNFNFVEIQYEEAYKMEVSGIGSMKVVDNFVDHFKFDNLPTFAEITDGEVV